MKARALEEEIAPTLLATAADLQELVDAKTDRTSLDLPVLKGWRRVLVGERLLQVLEGKLVCVVDPKTRTLRLRPAESAPTTSSLSAQ